MELMKAVESIGGRDKPAAMAHALYEEFELRKQLQNNRMWNQDLWFLIYNLVDLTQDQKPASHSKYYTSRPAAIVDTGRRVLSRNPIRYQVVADLLNQSREDREPVRRVENILHGVLYDIDRQMLRRGEMNSRSTVAFHALVRGQWAYKMHLTTAAKTSTGSPIHYRQYDPRMILPGFDLVDMESGIAFDFTTLAQLMGAYSSELETILTAARRREVNQSQDMSFMYVPLLLLEWSSREEHAVLVDLAGLPEELTRHIDIDFKNSDRRWLWLERPMQHGFGRSLIQVGNINGVPAGLASQEAADLYSRFSVQNMVPVDRGTGTVRGERLSSPTIYGPNNQVLSSAQNRMIDSSAAMAGRSIFATVAHLFPEYNDALSMFKDAVRNEVRGTWVFRSRDGKLIQLEVGTGKINALNLQESLEKMNPHISTPDVNTLLAYVNQDISDGSLDLRFLLAADFEGSGFLRARMEQGAVTPLADYKDGIEQWAVSVGESFLNQYRRAQGKFSNWKIHGRQPGMRTQFFVIDIDDQVKEALTSEEPPVIEAKVKVQLPIDMAARINTAKSAVDPNNPVMGLITAIELIMEMDDADGVWDEILEDLGNRNPTIQLAQIAAAFERAGQPEMAQMIMQDDFRKSFNNATQQGQTTTPSGAAAGTSANAAPPELTGLTEPAQQAA